MVRSLPLIAALLLAGCGLFGGGEADRVDSLAVAPETLAVARGDSLLAPATPVPSVEIVGDSVLLSATEFEALLRAVAAGRRDTLVVRIDTSRAATADTTGIRPVARIQEGLRFVGPRIVFSIVLLIGTFWVLRFLIWLIETAAERSARRRLLLKRLIPVTRMVVWSFAIYFVVSNIFEVDRNGLIAASAALGVGIGLAAQDVLKNILGGITIILDQPFQVGDKVAVGGTYGEVVSIGLRSTRIVTLDDSLVSVPNAQVVDSQVSNANAGALDCQVVTDLYLPGWVDVEKAKQIAYSAAANSRYVFLDKPIVVLVKDEFKETFLTHLVVKAYVLDTRYESVFASDITETSKIEFLREGLLQPVYGLNAPPHLAATARDPQHDGGAS